MGCRVRLQRLRLADMPGPVVIEVEPWLEVTAAGVRRCGRLGARACEVLADYAAADDGLIRLRTVTATDGLAAVRRVVVVRRRPERIDVALGARVPGPAPGLARDVRVAH